MEVTLLEILQAREQRVARQKDFLEKGHPVVSFSMNIAGPVKKTPATQRAFFYGVGLLRENLPILEEELVLEHTGCEGLFSVAAEPEKIKELCTKLEEQTPIGRLFDMDVLTADGEKLTRKVQRGCLVCGRPGRECAATRAHSVEDLQAATYRLIWEHFAEADSRIIGKAAVNALIYEVQTTPKPGLVDKNNNGSHKDMDLPLFISSAKSLENYFVSAVKIGMETPDIPECFSRLRQAGLQAEKTMFAATGGVNTHKGAIFTLGLLCGSIGSLWQVDSPFAGVDAVLERAKVLCADALGQDFEKEPSSYGERLYRQTGIAGIRGEAMNGFPNLQMALQVFEKCLAQGYSKNDAGVITLLHLIAGVEDTNLYHRGGAEGAAFAKKAAEKLLQNPDMTAVAELDRVFIERNLSPGGSADLLAAARFLHFLSVDNLDRL